MQQSPSWLTNRLSAIQEILLILWNQEVHYRIHLSLSWARSIQSISPHPNSWRYILILCCHLRLGLPSGLFHSGFPTKTLYKPVLSPISAACPTHLILLDLTTRIIFGEEQRELSSSLHSFLHFPVTSSLLGQNILSTVFSNVRSLLNVSNHVSHPYKTKRKIIVQYELIFIFSDRKLEEKGFWT